MNIGFLAYALCLSSTSMPACLPMEPRAPFSVRSGSPPRFLFLPRTSLTYLKPRFRESLRPIAAWLARTSVTANQVTLTSLAGSMLVSALLCVFAIHPVLFALLPVWLLARMACATIDGTLAIEFGQKSRLGGILNEAGDVFSDIVLFVPFAFVPPLSGASITLLIGLACMSELAGMAGPLFGSARRLEGPFGKSDRAIALSIIALAIAVLGHLPDRTWIVVPTFAAGSLLTIWNRLVCVTTKPSGKHDAK